MFTFGELWTLAVQLHITVQHVAFILNRPRPNFVSLLALLFNRTISVSRGERTFLKLFLIVRLWISRDLETKLCSVLFIILVVRQSLGDTPYQCKFEQQFVCTSWNTSVVQPREPGRLKAWCLLNVMNFFEILFNTTNPSNQTAYDSSLSFSNYGWCFTHTSFFISRSYVPLLSPSPWFDQG